MRQPNTAEEHNNLRYIVISIALLVLVSIVGYCFFGRGKDEAKTSTNPTTAHVAVSKKENNVEAGKKETAVEGQTSTFYLSLWGGAGAFLLTTFALASYHQQTSFSRSAKWYGFGSVFSSLFSKKGIPIGCKVLCAGTILALLIRCMGIEKNMLKDLCSDQNLVKNLSTISLSFILSSLVFFGSKVIVKSCKSKITSTLLGKYCAAALIESLIAVILTWMVHDIIAYQLSKKASNPSIKPTPKMLLSNLQSPSSIMTGLATSL